MRKGERYEIGDVGFGGGCLDGDETTVKLWLLHDGAPMMSSCKKAQVTSMYIQLRGGSSVTLSGIAMEEIFVLAVVEIKLPMMGKSPEVVESALEKPIVQAPVEEFTINKVNVGAEPTADIEKVVELEKVEVPRSVAEIEKEIDVLVPSAQVEKE
ncbi:hypothetical protein K7X08_028666 [Anisodus acutangulus]|uniref:Uncharacterized protein n=1 Tax=Anisodus acutangulus TaxID=402998 RepID=A0A9Q1LVI9_9SOLA|nr:hypothetical protein K7X08_028666 [Anisodus acutangulus]